MLTGKDEWLWRPVSNRDTLQISAFVDANPKGFGALLRQPRHRRLSGRRPALGAPPLAVGRADRRLGRGLGAARRDSVGIGEQRQYRRLLAAQAAARRRQGGDLRLSAVLVLGAAGAPAAWRSPIDARGGRAPGAKLRRFIVVFSGEVLADPQRAARSQSGLDDFARIGDEYSHVSQSAGENRAASSSTSTPPARPSASCASSSDRASEPISETWLYRWTPEPSRLTTPPRRPGRERDSGDPAAPPTPTKRRLSMPAQDLFQFDKRQRRRPAAPQLWRTPWLARLVTFGGGLALTVYGGHEMYRSSTSAASRR